jgi:DNA polymerase III subunit epsilon
MPLQLKKPLVIFDLETTGINVSKDRIIDIFLIKAKPDGTEESYYKRLNPGVPIPQETSEIHGIYDKDVVGCPLFGDIAKELNTFIEDGDFAGFNSNRFDFPLLVEEFYRADIDFDTEKRKFVDAQRIFHVKEPRNLAAAYQFYCNQSLENAHTAEADTKATWEIIKAQVDRYEDLPDTVEALHSFSGQNVLVDLAGRIKRNKAGHPCFAFGKHKGKTVEEVFKKEPSYFEWMMKGDFPENTKRVITRLMLQLKTAR